MNQKLNLYSCWNIIDDPLLGDYYAIDWNLFIDAYNNVDFITLIRDKLRQEIHILNMDECSIVDQEFLIL